MESRPILELALDQKTCSSGEEIATISDLSIRATRGDVIRLETGSDLATEGLIEVVSLRNLGFFGQLRFQGGSVEGSSDRFEEMRNRYVSRFPVEIEDENITTGELLTDLAIEAGLLSDEDTDGIGPVADEYDLGASVEKTLSSLPPAQSQLLSCAIVNMVLPDLLVIDGRIPPFPFARLITEAVLGKISSRSAIILVETIADSAWNFLSTSVRRVNVSHPGRSEPKRITTVGNFPFQDVRDTRLQNFL